LKTPVNTNYINWAERNIRSLIWLNRGNFIFFIKIYDLFLNFNFCSVISYHRLNSLLSLLCLCGCNLWTISSCSNSSGSSWFLTLWLILCFTITWGFFIWNVFGILLWLFFYCLILRCICWTILNWRIIFWGTILIWIINIFLITIRFLLLVILC
jgi:hypothetical protein